MTVKAQPDGYHSMTPYLIVKDAASAIEFYQKVFGAKSCSAWPARTERSGTPSSRSAIRW